MGFTEGDYHEYFQSLIHGNIDKTILKVKAAKNEVGYVSQKYMQQKYK